MDKQHFIPAPDGAPRAIRIAVLAMGGEGGGVLANWLVDLAEDNGHIAQMTSVPGVAQRTGATIYYIEMFPEATLKPGQSPVLAQMPTPGDVDIVVASELMEAGRAIQRGFVTPDRTTLIASSHRIFAMTEKIAMADGRVDEAALLSACRTAAQHFVAFDMMAVAERTGSVISAVLFGALAATKVLPFSREAFEATITQGGIGVQASLRAFAAGYDPTIQSNQSTTTSSGAPGIGHETGVAAFPAEFRDIVAAGFAQCVDWQDRDYAALYLKRLREILDTDRRLGAGDWALASEAARQLALAMTYEDTIRVADLKIRASRFQRVADEVGLKPGQLLQIREYLHPRLQEIAETLPGRAGRLLLEKAWLRRGVERMFAEGKVLETTSLRGFVQLYLIAGRRKWRRTNLRNQQEQRSIEAWLMLLPETAARNYRLAVEVAALRTLVKGYGDTHARGTANFNRIAALVPSLSGPGAAERLATLRKAAVADESGEALNKALAQNASVT